MVARQGMVGRQRKVQHALLNRELLVPVFIGIEA